MNDNIKKIHPCASICQLLKRLNQNFITVKLTYAFKKLVGAGIKNKFARLMPDLESDKDHSSIKNTLFIFLVFIFVFFGGSFYLYGKKIISDINEAGVIRNPSAFEVNARRLVRKSPIARMIPAISRQNEKTALFLIAIAKKESNWGKYSPKKGKKECYNYWGYRGTYNQTASGYSCFDSESQAVRVVGKRINELIGQGVDTPEKMIVWKCGESCAGHSAQSVRKWISDVDYYYHKINS
jgi:hypothetical protein